MLDYYCILYMLSSENKVIIINAVNKTYLHTKNMQYL